MRFGLDVVAAGRLGPSLATMATEGLTLAPFEPCGLPLAVTLPAGLLGPPTIAVCAAAVGPPVWIVWWWLAQRG